MNKTLFNLSALKKGIGYLVLFFVLPSLITIPFILIKKDTPLLVNIQNIIIYLCTTIIFILLSLKDLKKDLKSFNFKTFKKALAYWLIGLVLMISSSFILNTIGLPIPSNETTNNNILTKYPVSQSILAVMFFPIIEEIVFRLSVKDLSSNKHIYAITTGIFFALMHIPEALSSPIMLLHLIPYASCGIAFGYSYKNTNNIISTITTHSLHNLLNILQFIILGG